MALNKDYIIINTGVNEWHIDRFALSNKPATLPALHVIHNAGLFSCFSIRLMDIMAYYNLFGDMPPEIDDSQQFLHYKASPGDNISKALFGYSDRNIELKTPLKLMSVRSEPQFTDYKKIVFKNALPFIEKYFTPSPEVLLRVAALENKYQIDYNNTWGVFYRGNDKVTEKQYGASVGAYEEWGSKISQVIEDKYYGPLESANLRFFVLPDESEFMEYMLQNFQSAFTIEESPHMPKKNSCIFYELPREQRAEHALWFYAAVLIMSKCKYVVSHSGNGSFWCALYRGNVNNFYQYNNGWI